MHYSAAIAIQTTMDSINSFISSEFYKTHKEANIDDIILHGDGIYIYYYYDYNCNSNIDRYVISEKTNKESWDKIMEYIKTLNYII